MRALTTAALAVVLLPVLAADLTGQRRRRFPRRPPAAEPADPAEAPSEKKAAKVERWVAVRGGDVYLGTGQLLRRATVLIGDDKIKAVGHDLDVPDEAEVIDARGKAVAPGFIAVKARGMGAPSYADEEFADSLNPFSPDIKLGLSAGITSYLAQVDRGTDVPGGRSAVVKLAWGDVDGMLVAQDTVYTMRVPLSAAKWRALRERVEKAKEGLAQGKDAGKDAAKPADKSTTKGQGGTTPGRSARGGDKGPDAVTKILRGEAKLWVTSSGNFDVGPLRQALEISRLLGHGVVLDNPVGAWVIPDEVAATGSMAVVSPRLRVRPDPGRPDDTGSNLAQAAILGEAGVPVAVIPPGGRFGGSGLGRNGILGQDLHTLHLDAAFAVRGGMEDRRALRTITLDAAKTLGVAERIGSIEPGKDADLLILDGDPLHYRTFVETAIVNGKVVYEKDKEPFYSHIHR
ncbi:MAG: amidohydrolase family protein [Planctomycetota bacterium]